MPAQKSLCQALFIWKIFFGHKQCVRAVHVCCSRCRLQLDPAKTELIWFGPKLNLKRISNSDFSDSWQRFSHSGDRWSPWPWRHSWQFVVHASTNCQSHVNLFLSPSATSQHWQDMRQINNVPVLVLITDRSQSVQTGTPPGPLKTGLWSKIHLPYWIKYRKAHNHRQKNPRCSYAFWWGWGIQGFNLLCLLKQQAYISTFMLLSVVSDCRWYCCRHI